MNRPALSLIWRRNRKDWYFDLAGPRKLASMGKEFPIWADRWGRYRFACQLGPLEIGWVLVDETPEQLLKRLERQSNRELSDLSGTERLWFWFGLSRASWLTMPRVLMHEMPDEWQKQMAKLCEEWDETWDTDDVYSPVVLPRDEKNTFRKWPEWMLNYRRPDMEKINKRRKK